MVEKLRMKRLLEAGAKTEDFLALLIRSFVNHLSDRLYRLIYIYIYNPIHIINLK